MVTVFRAPLPLLFSVAVPPWVTALLLTLGWGWLDAGADGAAEGARTLLLSRQALVPVLLFAASAAPVALLGRLGRLTADQWPVAGGLFAGLSFLLVAAVSATWGDAFGLWLMAIWSLVSGYVLLVFVLGGYAWRRVFP